VLSPQRYNDRVGLAVVCPITSRIKGYPFEVEMRDVPRSRAPSWAITSAAFDWRARRAERAGRTPPDVLDEVVAKLRPLIEG
jgi:mRNA interferase MazF